MGFPLWSVGFCVLGVAIIIVVWYASSDMKDCASDDLHNCMQIALMLGCFITAFSMVGAWEHDIMSKAGHLPKLLILAGTGVALAICGVTITNHPDVVAKAGPCIGGETYGPILTTIGAVILGIFAFFMVSSIFHGIKEHTAKQVTATAAVSEERAAQAHTHKQAKLDREKESAQKEAEIQAYKDSVKSAKESQEKAKKDAREADKEAKAAAKVAKIQDRANKLKADTAANKAAQKAKDEELHAATVRKAAKDAELIQSKLHLEQIKANAAAAQAQMAAATAAARYSSGHRLGGEAAERRRDKK